MTPEERSRICSSHRITEAVYVSSGELLVVDGKVGLVTMVIVLKWSQAAHLFAPDVTGSDHHHSSSLNQEACPGLCFGGVILRAERTRAMTTTQRVGPKSQMARISKALRELMPLHRAGACCTPLARFPSEASPACRGDTSGSGRTSPLTSDRIWKAQPYRQCMTACLKGQGAAGTSRGKGGNRRTPHLTRERPRRTARGANSERITPPAMGKLLSKTQGHSDVLRNRCQPLVKCFTWNALDTGTSQAHDDLMLSRIYSSAVR